MPEFVQHLIDIVEARLLPGDYPLSYHGISGYTGGGRQMVEEYEALGDKASQYMPYALTFQHKHLPEMAHYAKLNRAPLFEPLVGNFAQGMSTSLPRWSSSSRRPGGRWTAS